MSNEIHTTRKIITTFLRSIGTTEALNEAVIINAKINEKLFLEHVKALIDIFTKAKEELEKMQNG